MSKKRKAWPADPVEAQVESLTHDGRGVARVDGKAVFVHGALPGERVRFRYTRRLRRHDEGVAMEVLTASPQRVEPRCGHFGVCGGCVLQHLESAAQIESKQAILEEVMRRLGNLTPARWLPPLSVKHWGYRRKARLGVRWVAKKGRVLVGFRERGSSFVADLSRCDVLHPAVGERIDDLARLIEGLSIRERLPQIEIAQGDGPVVLVLRVLDPPSEADIDRLLSFAADTGLHLYLQSGGIESIQPLPGQSVDLCYDLPRQDTLIGFEPTDFTQVNLELNRAMVSQALDLLDLRPADCVLDLFCGVGNFTLPIARHVERVVGVEGEAGLVERAERNAERNGIHNAVFNVADLYGDLTSAPWLDTQFDKALLDPPRSGAIELLERLSGTGVRRLVYVSCYPATLARDAAKLVNDLGFRLEAAGAMDMFPHTAHLEAMALFERD